MKDFLPKRAEEDVELCDDSIDEERPSDRTPRITPDESHQETEAD